MENWELMIGYFSDELFSSSASETKEISNCFQKVGFCFE
jgi:hypothetical protein